MQGTWWAIGTAVGSLLALAYYAFVVAPARLHRLRCEGLRAFARLVELRTQGRCGKSDVLADLAGAVAMRLGMRLHERRRLELAVYLRDIGMVAIPYSVLNKTGEPTLAERELLRRHAEISASIAEQIPGMSSVAGIVRLHHVVYSEQPNAPLGAHIISALDDWLRAAEQTDADFATSLLKQGAGACYHPRVAQAILSELSQRSLGGWRELTRSAALWL
ncbi:MAG: HD domain-containing protein [bacterium]|nr:HD domain-containing protein [bacterium]